MAEWESNSNVPYLMERELLRVGLGKLNYSALSDTEVQNVIDISDRYYEYHMSMATAETIADLPLGALELHVHSTSGIAPQRTDRMLRRRGFKTYGGSYVTGVGS